MWPRCTAAVLAGPLHRAGVWVPPGQSVLAESGGRSGSNELERDLVAAGSAGCGCDRHAAAGMVRKVLTVLHHAFAKVPVDVSSCDRFYRVGFAEDMVGLAIQNTKNSLRNTSLGARSKKCI